MLNLSIGLCIAVAIVTNSWALEAIASSYVMNECIKMHNNNNNIYIIYLCSVCTTIILILLERIKMELIVVVLQLMSQ